MSVVAAKALWLNVIASKSVTPTQIAVSVAESLQPTTSITGPDPAEVLMRMIDSMTGRNAMGRQHPYHSEIEGAEEKSDITKKIMKLIAMMMVPPEAEETSDTMKRTGVSVVDGAPGLHALDS